MGLNIHDDQRVEFDDTHQDRVDTSLEKNMTSTRVEGIACHFVYWRKQSSSGEQGDGNPLIYALKEMKGYRIDPVCRKLFMDRAQAIVLKDRAKITADIIVPVPSSYEFCRQFSEELGVWTGLPVVPTDFIGKKTVSQVLAENTAAPPVIKKKYVRTMYKAQLKDWSSLPPNSQVTMKRLDKKIRPYFNHLGVSDTVAAEVIKGQSVLVVDDLMASGTSMRCTMQLLLAAGASAVTGLCFLSGL